MEPIRRRISPDAHLYKVVVISSLVGSLINCTVLAVSAISGRWLFGHVCCQLFGLLSQVLVAGSAWMIALTAMERVYHHFIPTEHAATFSEISMKILTYGMYLLLMVFHTAPLYGWGEYSNLRGNINMEVYSSPYNSTVPEVPVSPRYFVLTLGNNSTCIHENTTSLEPKPANFFNVLSHFLRTTYRCEIRFHNNVVIWTLILRFTSGRSLDMFYKEFYPGEMTEKVYMEYMKAFDSCNSTKSMFYFAFDVQSEHYQVYKDAHVSFQDIGICSLDYSPTNSTVISWIPFVIITSVVLPYAITFVTGTILKISRLDSRDTVVVPPSCFIAGSTLCLASTVPYYYINILNHNNVPVSHGVNIALTTIYFTHSIGFVILCSCYSCLKRQLALRRDTNAGTSLSMASIDENEVKELSQEKDETLES